MRQGYKFIRESDRKWDDEQQGESNSILNQKRFLEDFARKSGMKNIKHFTDDGYTGRNFNRSGFQAML